MSLSHHLLALLLVVAAAGLGCMPKERLAGKGPVSEDYDPLSEPVDLDPPPEEEMMEDPGGGNNDF